jgi:hypothetical protein
VLLSHELSHHVHQGGLLVSGYPAGDKAYFDSRISQGARCFMEVKLAESRGNNCSHALLFDIDTRLVIVVVGAAIVLGVIGRLQVDRIQDYAQQMSSGT